MPADAVELVPYFRNVEQSFDDFKVEKELQVHLLKPHLTEAARVLTSHMEPIQWRQIMMKLTNYYCMSLS